ncbi:MAG: hypothetical protein IBJ11_02785 [Phycisphaerales bacterium]|nr:hypothetical protein [Phycisphaerales bacterium]
MLATMGSAGDLHPFLAIACEMRGRGHIPLLVVPEGHTAAVRRAGFDPAVLPLRSTVADPGVFLHPWKGSANFLKHVVVPSTAGVVRRLDELIGALRPDIIVAHQTVLGTPWAAARHSVPFAIAAIAPASWPSVENPSVYPGMPDRDRYRPWMLRMGHAIGAAVTNRLVDPPLNRLRRELGMPPGRAFLLEEQFSGSLNLGLWSPRLRGPASDDRPRSLIAGFTWFDAGDEPSQGGGGDLLRWLDDGEPPIVFTLGTSAVAAAVDRRCHFYEAAADAAAELGRRALLLVGQDANAPRLACAELRVERYVPHSMVMPRACAVVHHAGLNTLAQALRAGRPSVIVPHAHDQFDNARRSRLLGVSVTLPRRRLSRRTLVEALDRVLSEPGFTSRAEALSASLAVEDGAARAVDALEAVLGGAVMTEPKAGSGRGAAEGVEGALAPGAAPGFVQNV